MTTITKAPGSLQPTYNSPVQTANTAKKMIDPLNPQSSAKDLVESLDSKAFTFTITENGQEKKREGAEYFLNEYILPESKKLPPDEQNKFLNEVVEKLVDVNTALENDHTASANKEEFRAAVFEVDVKLAGDLGIDLKLITAQLNSATRQAVDDQTIQAKIAKLNFSIPAA